MIARGLALPLLALLVPWSPDAAAGTVNVATVSGPINSAIEDYLVGAVERSEAEGAVALVIELDTPGGLVTSTQGIVSAILNADVPVIVFVSPRGAWAASAGTFITMAGHVAAMAPGTSIGAAHPVSLGGGGPTPAVPGEPPGEGEDEDEDEKTDPKPRPILRDFGNEKAENFTAAFLESIAEQRGRNTEWAAQAVRDSVAVKQSEALELNVIDLIAEDLDHLLEQLDGRVVKVGRREVTLATKDARVVEIEMALANRILAVIADPTIIFLLMLVGAACLYMEVQAPGMIIPGVIGAACLVLVAIAMQIIPFNWVGLLLVIFGLGLLVAEIYVAGFGLLFAPGILCLGAGAYMTFRVPELSDLTLPFWTVILPMLVVLSGFMAIVVFGVARSFARPAFAGAESLLGAIAIAESDLDPTGRVRLRGELWSAESESPARCGESVEIVEVNDLLVRVRPVPDPRGGEA